MTTARQSAILDPSGQPFMATPAGNGVRYESMPAWLAARNWEAGETTRLNEAHWLYDTEKPINEWLSERLEKTRARAIYESRNNGTLAGILVTLADDVVGADGPVLEVQSDNEAYNTAAEAAWREWFRAPTTRPNVSGAATLKLWVRNLPRCGEFLARIVTDSTAPGPVSMRLRPTPPRRLASPTDQAANPRLRMGIEFDRLDRPVRYWIAEDSADGYTTTYEPWPPELIIHEFWIDEEEQARGFPWFNPSLQPSADLRDYDDQVQDAARTMADQSALLYNENPETPCVTPGTTTVQRRTIKMAPPGWKPFVYPATQPPVQYPDYRAERQREIGRPFCMPLMIVRLDSSKHNYSSARFDGQSYARFVAGIQLWLSGSDQSYGTLNRLLDEVLREARFSAPILRRRPPKVSYKWTWPSRPHVDPLKERAAVEVGLRTRSLSLTDALAAEGKSIDTHIETLKREQQKFQAAELPLPAWMTGQSEGQGLDPEGEDDAENAKAASNG
jgi:capsid protein